ncbi:hypothetical protein KRX54_00960 [Actinomycetaceae bacterium TAE3-ERU4]|nr:hypothetical protein [Actinomycetaceae bacterium TAE3-ERU4]
MSSKQSHILPEPKETETTSTVDDRSLQYRTARGGTGEIGIVLDNDAQAKTWVTVRQATKIMLITAGALAALIAFGAFIQRDILTAISLATAAIVSLGLPRSVGAPAPRHSSTVSLIFSWASILTVRALDDLYISGIIFALSVVAAFGAEMARKDGRARLLDSVSTTILTTAAATCSVAIVGLAPHESWKLALVSSAICVFASMGIFETMRHFWPGAAKTLKEIRELPKTTEAWRPGSWIGADSKEYKTFRTISRYWALTDTARTVCVLFTGIVGSLLAGTLYQLGLITGNNAEALQQLGTFIGGGPIPALVVGLFVGLLSGLIVIVGGRVLRPTTTRVSLWGAIAWGVLPTIVMAMPTYALVRMGS